jgi:hypothetical protein
VAKPILLIIRDGWGINPGGREKREENGDATLLARTPLRVRLIVAVLVLVTVSLALISVASIAVLRGSLVGRLDDQLGGVAAATLRGLAGGRALGPPPSEGRIRPPSLYFVAVLDPSGNAL